MNELVVTIIIILLPGIIATIISDKIAYHSKWSSFKFSLYSLVLGIFTYSLLQSFVYTYGIIRSYNGSSITWNHLDVWNIAFIKNPTIPVWEVGLAILLSVPVALFASWSINFKLFNKVGKLLHITNKYGDENLYSYFLNSKEIDWVYVRDPNRGFTYQGRIESFSENDNIQELVMSEVTVYNYSDSTELYTIPSLYLSSVIGNFIIEIIPEDSLGEQNVT